jgi:phenylpropionate dioxygenase-like ring-hydroxylating dioxygenase large terminal subunit
VISGTATQYDQLVQADRVHRSVYVEPEVFREEMAKIFGATWVYLGHESEISEPDDFKTTRLGTRSVILTRDSGGTVHALLNRCSHRASIVCNELRGSKKTFECPYHGWTYRNDGSLQGVPFREGYGDGFDASRRGLARLPHVSTYRGFIFGTMNADPPELEAWLGNAVDKLDIFINRTPGIRVRNRHQLLFRGNWKLAWDNAGDGLHPTFVHRSLLLMNAERHGGGKQLAAFKSNPDETPMYAEDLGNGHSFLDLRPILRTFWAAQRPFPGMEVWEQRLREREGDARAEELLEVVPASYVNVSIFPNLLIVANQLQIVEPLAVDETRLSFYICAAEGLPDEINVMRMRIGEDFPAMGNTDDLEIFERCHEGLSVPEIEWIDMSKGYGSEFDVPDERGIRRTPITHDAVMRGYLREWLRLMTADPELTVG